MNLEFDTSLEDISEPQIRQHLRSKTFQKQRFTEPIYTGLVSVITIYVITSIMGFSMPWWSYPLAFLAGYAVIYFTLRDTVTKRMRNYIKTEIGHKMPASTSYLIEKDKIRCNSLGSEITLDLEHLSEIREDTTHLELNFGDIGLCTIPIRAFKDISHKQAFLKNIRRGQGGDGEGDENV